MSSVAHFIGLTAKMHSITEAAPTMSLEQACAAMGAIGDVLTETREMLGQITGMITDDNRAEMLRLHQAVDEARTAAFGALRAVNARIEYLKEKAAEDALKEAEEFRKKFGDGTIIEDFGPMSGGKPPEDAR